MLRFIALWLNCNLVGLGPRFLVLGNELCINLVDREFFRDQGRELLLDCQVSLEKALCNFASLSLRQESKEVWEFGCPSIRPYVHNPKVIEAGPKRISHSALGCPTPLPRSAQPVVVQRRVSASWFQHPPEPQSHREPSRFGSAGCDPAMQSTRDVKPICMTLLNQRMKTISRVVWMLHWRTPCHCCQ